MLIYFVLINIVSIIITIADKKKAVRNKWRISENTLILFSVLGGSVSMYLTMKIIRHKTLHKKFMIGIPLIIFVQVLLIALYYFYF